MSAHFITATGTDIGKTWLTCALIAHWRTLGLRPQAFKPVLSGFDPAQAAASDAGQILQALGRPLATATLDAIDAIAPWRFAAPLSPDMAAGIEGRRIDFAALVDFTRRAAGAAAGDAPVLVEGVGGAMAPLDETHTVRDWIAASGLPCVLVAGSYLGSLSHTLSAWVALEKVGVGVTAIMVNESPGATVSLAASAESLRRYVGGVPVLTVARAAPAAGVAVLAALLA